MKSLVRHILPLMLTLTACGSGNEDEILSTLPKPEPAPTPVPSPVIPNQDNYPIAFSSTQAETQNVSTRAASPLKRSFVVYGYKYAGSEQKVFDGYTVDYREGSANTATDNTHGYYYVGAKDNQTIKYWDFSASEYHFWGLSQVEGLANPASFSSDGKTLTIPKISLREGDEHPADDILFSSLYVRQPISQEVVRLEFLRPYCQLSVLFYTDLTFDDKDKIDLSKIEFTPVSEDGKANKIFTQGTVTITYPAVASTSPCTATETFSTIVADGTDKTIDNLTFQNVTLTKDHGTSLTNAQLAKTASEKKYFFPLPMGDKNPSFKLTVSVDEDDELQSAVVPATYMNWKPNYSYTYVFKILEGGVIFVDAIIDDWKEGGSGSVVWPNW